VIKHFTDTISTDRKLMADMTADFSKVLGNHVDHSTKEQAHSRAVIEQQGKVIDRNADALNRVSDLLSKYSPK
jgi:flagellar hook-basal body complex protein FliE